MKGGVLDEETPLNPTRTLDESEDSEESSDGVYRPDVMNQCKYFLMKLLVQFVCPEEAVDLVSGVNDCIFGTCLSDAVFTGYSNSDQRFGND